MKIAYILYDGITLLDFIGIYDPISRMRSLGFLSDLKWDLCSTKEFVSDSFGLTLKMDKVNPDLSTYDAIIVPGGFGTRPLQEDQAFIQWLKGAESVKHKLSICTGSLLLGAAGFLKNTVATTHFNEYKVLETYCKRVSFERIVDHDNILTSGAVASSLDLGLYFCRKFLNDHQINQILKSMDYHSSTFEVEVI